MKNLRYLSIAEPYDRKGVEKIKWVRIGEIFTEEDGREYARLYSIMNKIRVFEAEQEDQPTKS